MPEANSTRLSQETSEEPQPGTSAETPALPDIRPRPVPAPRRRQLLAPPAAPVPPASPSPPRPVPAPRRRPVPAPRQHAVMVS